MLRATSLDLGEVTQFCADDEIENELKIVLTLVKAIKSSY